MSKKSLSSKKIAGIFSIIAGFLIFVMRPVAECSWYQVGCKASGAFTTLMFTGIMIIFIIIGIVLLAKK